MSTLLSLRATRSLAAGVDLPGNDYKALVCLFLFGGNDGFNTLVPNDSDGYANYKRQRSNMALDQSSLLGIKDQDGRDFGLHPALENTRDMYNQGEVAMVANVVRSTSFNEGHLNSGMVVYPSRDSDTGACLRYLNIWHPLDPIAPASRSRESGEIICALTETEPADSPAMVTLPVRLCE